MGAKTCHGVLQKMPRELGYFVQHEHIAIRTQKIILILTTIKETYSSCISFVVNLYYMKNVHTVDDLCIYTSGLIHTLKFGGINYHMEPWSDSPQLFLWCHLILFIKKNFFIESKLLHDLPAKNYKSCKQNRGFRGFDQMFN